MHRAEEPFTRSDMRRIERRDAMRQRVGLLLCGLAILALMAMTQQVIEWRGMP